jgi:hypothetical protein
MTLNNKALNESLTMAFICSFGKFGSKILAKTLNPNLPKKNPSNKASTTRSTNANKFGSKVLAKKS